MSERKIISFIILIFFIFLVGCNTKDTLVINFETNGGESISSIKIEKSEVADYQFDYEGKKEGYTFLGWYFDEELTNPFLSLQEIFNKENMVNEVTLYANYKEIDEKLDDEIKPLIQYNGSLGVNPILGTDTEIDFMEGMLALDNIDGIITDNIIVETPDFNISVPGLYYVFYTVKDSSNNMSEVFVRMFTLKKMFAGDKVGEGSIDSVNGIRYENYMVYYTYEKKGSTTTANQWGYEISVNSNGYVVEVNTNVTMLEGGFALSGVGSSKELLMDVQVGDLVSVDIPTKTYTIVRDPIKSNLFKIDLNIEKAKFLLDEAYNAGISFDIENANKIYQEMLAIKETMNEDTLEKDIISKGNEVTSKWETITFMTTYTKDCEVRAVWHRPNVTGSEVNLKGIISVLDKFQSYGFNVIFLETFWNGYASYRSSILETHPNLVKFSYGEEYGNDYVLAFISEASKRGIEVHAWCHMFNAGSLNMRSSIVKDSMLVTDYQGRYLHPNDYGGAYYYDPSNEEVLTLLENVLKEMVTKYDFAGVQYDYIRYYDNNYSSSPIRDSGYGENAEALFKQAYNLSGDVRTMILNPLYRSSWNEWRMSNITKAVARFTKTIRNNNSNVTISAAVVSPIEYARNTYMQDWLTWVKAGNIDLLCPMIYTGSSKAIKEQSDTIVSQLENKTLLATGIAPTYYGYSVLIAHNEIAATIGASGYAYFASQNIFENLDLVNALRVGMNRKEVISPYQGALDIRDYVINILINNIDSIYIERNLLSEEKGTTIKNDLSTIKSLPCESKVEIELIISKLEEIKAKIELKDYVIIYDIDNLINILKYKLSK